MGTLGESRIHAEHVGNTWSFNWHIAAAGLCMELELAEAFRLKISGARFSIHSLYTRDLHILVAYSRSIVLRHSPLPAVVDRHGLRCLSIFVLLRQGHNFGS